MRQRPGEHDRVSRMIVAQTQKRMSEFKGKPLTCPAVLEDESESGLRTCGSMLFEQKFFVTVQYVPEIVCGQPGGTMAAMPIPFLECIRCGHLMSPNEWEPMAKEAYESENRIITPREMEPRDNGKD